MELRFALISCGGCLHSYAALDARVLLSIAAVLDQQLCDGVAARNQLRRVRARTRTAKATVTRDAGAYFTGAVCSSASLASNEDADAASTCNSSTKDEDTPEQMKAQNVHHKGPRQHNNEGHVVGVDVFQSRQNSCVVSGVATSASDQARMSEGDDELMDEEALQLQTTIEAVRPRVHCYLPLGRDFTTT